MDVSVWKNIQGGFDSKMNLVSDHVYRKGVTFIRSGIEFDLDALVEATKGFSGSEIEQAVVSAMYSARAHKHNLTQQDLISEIQQTRPLSVVMAEKVQETRDWASSRTVPCD